MTLKSSSLFGSEIISDDIKGILGTNLDWARFSGKKVLITGANGFLPAYMAEVLFALNQAGSLDSPCHIILLVRNIDHAKTRFQKHLHSKEVELICHDVSNPFPKGLQADFIIHAASPASPKFYAATPLSVIYPNIFGTKYALDLAQEQEVESFLYFSSGEVYGNVSGQALVDETHFGSADPLAQRACYPESKRMGETLCASYFQQHGVPTKVVRPFHTYGPGMKLDDGRVFADFVKNIVQKQDIEMKSDGLAERPFCYLADAAVAFFTILLKGENANAYNVANPNQMISVKGLAEMLVSLFPEMNLKVHFAPQDDNYIQSTLAKMVPDISKISTLGWSPTTSLREGFSRTIRSYLTSLDP